MPLVQKLSRAKAALDNAQMVFPEEFFTSSWGLRDAEMLSWVLQAPLRASAAGRLFLLRAGGDQDSTSFLGRFMQELTEMLGFRPYQFYYYTWKYVSPICMAVLMTASIIQLGVSPPGYSAWIREEVSTAPAQPSPAGQRRAHTPLLIPSLCLRKS